MHFWIKMAQNAHKMAQNGTSRGLRGVKFGFLRPPDPLGTLKNQFGAKTNFVKKTRFLAVFGTHFGHFVCKMGPNGHFVSGGPKSVLRTPNQLRTP